MRGSASPCCPPRTVMVAVLVATLYAPVAHGQETDQFGLGVGYATVAAGEDALGGSGIALSGRWIRGTERVRRGLLLEYVNAQTEELPRAFHQADVLVSLGWATSPPPTQVFIDGRVGLVHQLVRAGPTARGLSAGASVGLAHRMSSTALEVELSASLQWVAGGRSDVANSFGGGLGRRLGAVVRVEWLPAP